MESKEIFPPCNGFPLTALFFDRSIPNSIIKPMVSIPYEIVFFIKSLYYSCSFYYKHNAKVFCENIEKNEGYCRIGNCVWLILARWRLFFVIVECEHFCLSARTHKFDTHKFFTVSDNFNIGLAAAVRLIGKRIELNR